MKRAIRKSGKLVSIEDYAFYTGAQGVPSKDGLLEIEHSFSQSRSKLEAESIPKQKGFETVLAQNAAIRPQVEDEWKKMLDRFGNHPPSVVMAYVMAALGIVALLVDAVLTGPSLDALGISEPVLQYLSAFALASLSSVVFHLTMESFESTAMDWRTRWGCRMLAGFAVMGLVCWGILRGHEVAFGADLASNPLGGFLRGHFFLSSVVFCFITLGSPLAAAFSVGHAVPLIHGRIRWQKAHRSHRQLVDSTAKAQKALESEKSQLAQALRSIDAERREWQACFLQYHHRGQERGGREEPHWLVVGKSVAVGIGTAMIAFPFGIVFWPAFLLPVATGCAAFVYFRKVRHTPSYRKFRQQEATRFSVTSSLPPERALSQPQTIEARLESGL